MFDYSKYMLFEFEDRGRGPSAYDCWGLARLIMREQFNVELPSYAVDYSSAFNKLEVEQVVADESVNWVSVEQPQEGDIVTLRIGGHPWHCGVMISDRQFIHIEPSTGVVVESIDSPMWARRVSCFHRHRSRVNV